MQLSQNLDRKHVGNKRQEYLSYFPRYRNIFCSGFIRAILILQHCNICVLRETYILSIFPVTPYVPLSVY